MLDFIADIIPTLTDDLAELLALLGGYLAGGLLIVLLAWAIGYAVRALFDIVEFMTM